MPKLNESQVTGIVGEKWFPSILPDAWIPQPPPFRDVGVDAVVVICDDGPLNGLEFKVQIKSSKRWTIRNSAVVCSGIKVSTIRDLLLGFTPSLLVLHETSTGRGVCAWINQLVGQDLSLVSKRKKTVSLRVPVDRCIDQAMWVRIGNELRALSIALGRRVVASERALPVIRFLHGMTEVLELLDFVANARKTRGEPTEEDDLFLAQAEVFCHSNVVRNVRRLDEALAGSPVTIAGLAEFATDYEKKCSEFVKEFKAVVKNPETRTSVSVNVPEMRSRRQGFTRSILSAMRQVSELGLGTFQAEAEQEKDSQANKKLNQTARSGG